MISDRRFAQLAREHRGAVEGWLIRICRNCLVDLAARPAAQPTAELPDSGETSDGLHELYDLIARLPVNQREVVAVCAFLGYDYAGAAELLEVPIGTVRSRLHRARAAIAAQLDNGGEALA
jgi:RNA polymerase sigma-70 factor, ECF subfamily